MRVFFAVLLPKTITSALAEVQNGLAGIPQVRLVPVSNMHITLSFIGDVHPSEVSQLVNKAQEISCSPAVVRLGGLSGFPRNNRWRVAVAGVKDDSASLKRMYALLPQGEKPERNFVPHITLARSPIEQQSLPNIVVPELDFMVQEFHLMESVLRPQGPLYRSVQGFSL